MYGFITGAASGIGYATANRLLSDGWVLALADVVADKLQQLAQQYPEQVYVYPFDVLDRDAYQQAITDFVVRHDEQLNLLFNCAGILSIGRFDQIDADRHKAIVDINVQGVVNGCELAYPYLRNTAGAQVISMSSASAIYGVPHFAVYSASKFAVRGLTEALNIEWKKDGIHVGDIMPPFVNTPMLQEQKVSVPVLDTLGVDMSADEVAEAVVRQIKKPRVHRTVGGQLSVLYLLSQLLPSAVTRKIMAFLAKES